MDRIGYDRDHCSGKSEITSRKQAPLDPNSSLQTEGEKKKKKTK